MKKLVFILFIGIFSVTFAQDIKELEKACSLNDSLACYNLGVFYLKGKGVRQNYFEAKEYYGKACDLGLQIGCDDYKRLNNSDPILDYYYKNIGCDEYKRLNNR